MRSLARLALALALLAGSSGCASFASLMTDGYGPYQGVVVDADIVSDLDPIAPLALLDTAPSAVLDTIFLPFGVVFWSRRHGGRF